MAQGAGTVGEGVTSCTVNELLDETLVGIREAPRVLREVPDAVAQSPLRLPPRAVSQALRSLVTNAQDASPATSAVVVSARLDGPRLALLIRDRGGGISNDVLEKIGEPFFTTKAPGRGMGLGLFLARAVIEGVGGTLQIDTGQGGTAVRVMVPTDVRTQPTAPAMVSNPT